jgi:hypothetical protein
MMHGLTNFKSEFVLYNKEDVGYMFTLIYKRIFRSLNYFYEIIVNVRVPLFSARIASCNYGAVVQP